MSTELLDAIHDNVRCADNAVDDVYMVARSLRAVGMDRAADNLEDAVAFLRASARRISDAHTDDVQGQIRHGEDMMGGILNAIVAGAIVPVKSKRSDAK